MEARPRHIVGLDLGQQQDPTALVMLEFDALPIRLAGQASPPNYRVRTLKRWPAGTPFAEIAEAVVRFLSAPPLASSEPAIVIDETGVGQPVVQMIVQKHRAANLPGGYLSVTISAGHEVLNTASARWQVPKKELVSVLQVLLQSRRLHIPADLAESQTLVRELALFRPKVRLTGDPGQDSWRERDHDDLVLALGIACWWAEWNKKDWFYGTESRPVQYVIV